MVPDLGILRSFLSLSFNGSFTRKEGKDQDSYTAKCQIQLLSVFRNQLLLGFNFNIQEGY